MARFACLMILVLGLLAGCSPEYNWRQVPVAGGMVRATFPDKPETAKRSLNFAGHAVEFTLTAATVNGAVFAVGYAPLPAALADDEAARTKMGQTVMASFYQNLGAEIPAELPAFGEAFEIMGKDAGKGAMRLQAMTWVLPHALVEGMVTARADAFPESQAREFLKALAAGVR
ncbi:MAG TPA: hypothetical protein VNT00_12940 [Eoetvoesiella sp.]|jgi:hypothetical protein|uniref:hypothetical protein n=1 Tax=Eoetvoesiella sp. TaxID=1966355 RepID=UPI002C38800F|nr:hypothetical protein [Eoetvoesiella sp.]HWK62318.1 hypothetical protein [Eoetvoesiella sp.]